MDKETQSREISILSGSGSGELQTISGSMNITQDENGHSYEFTYQLWSTRNPVRSEGKPIMADVVG